MSSDPIAFWIFAVILLGGGALVFFQSRGLVKCAEDGTWFRPKKQLPKHDPKSRAVYDIFSVFAPDRRRQFCHDKCEEAWRKKHPGEES